LEKVSLPDSQAPAVEEKTVCRGGIPSTGEKNSRLIRSSLKRKRQWQGGLAFPQRVTLFLDLDFLFPSGGPLYRGERKRLSRRGNLVSLSLWKRKKGRGRNYHQSLSEIDGPGGGPSFPSTRGKTNTPPTRQKWQGRGEGSLASGGRKRIKCYP